MESPPGADGRSIAANSARLLSARVIGNLGFFVAVVILARGLEPSGRGTIAFLTVGALIIARVSALGVTNATMVFAARQPEARDRLLANLFGFTLVSSLAAVALVVALLAVLEDARPAGIGAVELAIFVPGTVAAALIESGYFFLIGCARFRSQAMITSTAPWLYAGALVAVAASSELTVERAALVWLGSSVVWAALLAAACLRGTGLARPTAELFRASVRFGVRAWGGGVARFLNLRLDQVLMGFMVAEASLGIYAVAVNCAEVLLYLPAAASTALLPVISRADSRERAVRALGVFRSVAVLTGGAIAIAALLGPVGIPLVFGADYRGAVTPFLILLAGAFGFAATRVFSSALLASSAPGLSSLGSAASVLVGVVLDLVLIPLYGATGAAVASTVAFLVGGATAATAYRRQAGFRWLELLPRPADVAGLASFVRDAVRRTRSRTVATGK